ncbi:MAG: hypothetical protein WCG93_10045 [Paludibacter sp.]
MTLREHLNHFYQKYNIPANGGVEFSTFEVPLPFFTLILPNLSWRKKMLYIHDLEHILNGQDTSWKGEMFIASWEISTGFWKSFPIIIFPLWTMGWGLWKHPTAVLKGFRKGNTDRGIAKLNVSQNDLLEMDLSQLQALTLQQRPKHSSLYFNGKFTTWALASQIVFWLPAMLLYALIVYLLK